MKNLVCEICGMNLNNKNYDLNKDAFLFENNSEYIKYCPFCGAGEIYIGENFEAIKVKKESLDNITLNILDHAVKLEIFNGDFYSEAAKLCIEDKNKKIFKALSNIEYMHAKIHQKLAGYKKLPTISKLDYSKYNGNDDILFEMAEKREIHAVQYYKKYGNVVKDEQINKIFKALSQVEQDHIVITAR